MTTQCIFRRFESKNLGLKR